MRGHAGWLSRADRQELDTGKASVHARSREEPDQHSLTRWRPLGMPIVRRISTLLTMSSSAPTSHMGRRSRRRSTRLARALAMARPPSCPARSRSRCTRATRNIWSRSPMLSHAPAFPSTSSRSATESGWRSALLPPPTVPRSGRSSRGCPSSDDSWSGHRITVRRGACASVGQVAAPPTAFVCSVVELPGVRPRRVGGSIPSEGAHGFVAQRQSTSGLQPGEVPRSNRGESSTWCRRCTASSEFQRLLAFHAVSRVVSAAPWAGRLWRGISLCRTVGF